MQLAIINQNEADKIQQAIINAIANFDRFIKVIIIDSLVSFKPHTGAHLSHDIDVFRKMQADLQTKETEREQLLYSLDKMETHNYIHLENNTEKWNIKRRGTR